VKTGSKVGIVLAGYAVAVLAAFLVVSLYVAATNTPDRVTYGAMFGFGDLLLFLGVLGVAAVPATGAGLFWLRTYPWFWRALSSLAVVVAVTALAAVADYLYVKQAGPQSWVAAWSAFSVLRIFAAPLFAIAFILSGLFAPSRWPRIALIGAGLVEGASFAGIVALWVHSPR
jgi:hypothetical protein